MTRARAGMCASFTVLLITLTAGCGDESQSLGEAKASNSARPSAASSSTESFLVRSVVVQGKGRGTSDPVTEFSEVMTELEGKHPDLMTQWGVPPRGEVGPNWVIAPVQSEVALVNALRGLGTDTQLRLGAPAGMQTMEESVALVMSSLLKSGAVSVNGSSYDDDGLHSLVGYVPKAGASDADVSRALDRALAALKAKRGSAYVPGEVELVEEDHVVGVGF